MTQKENWQCFAGKKKSKLKTKRRKGIIKIRMEIIKQKVEKLQRKAMKPKVSSLKR